MAKPTNAKYETAAMAYQAAANKYSGAEGYNESLNAAQNGVGITDTANAKGMEQSKEQTRLSNEEARKYARSQAEAAATHTQGQATTAARSAGMNKAQAAMLGSQQNANAYQNAYANAYNQQLGLSNANTQNSIANYSNNMNNQQATMANMGNANINAKGQYLAAAQQAGQQEYENKWGNVGNTLGLIGSFIKPFSDEKLKHYRECSKKVVVNSPNKIKSLKYVAKEE